MKLNVSKKCFWDVVIYDWSSNKARRKRRKNIQKAKRSNRRNSKMALKSL